MATIWETTPNRQRPDIAPHGWRALLFILLLFPALSALAAPPPLLRHGLTTNAGEVVITATNWPGFVTNVVNVRQFGAKGDGVNDDTAAIQAAFNAGYTCSEVLIPFGVYRITSTLTNRAGGVGMRVRGMVPGFGAGSGVGGHVVNTGSTLLWQGATNGTLLSLDGCTSPWFENLAFQNVHTNACKILVNIDQTGAGSMTDWMFYNCTFANENTNLTHHFIACNVAPISTSNCEGGQWINTYWKGSGVGMYASSNRAFGLVIGNNPNALKLRVIHANAFYFTNWFVMTNGSIDIEDGFFTGNHLDLNVIGGSDWVNFRRLRSEAYRKFFRTDGLAVQGSGVKFEDIGVADVAGRNTNSPIFDIQGQCNLSFHNVEGGGAQPLQPFIRFSGPQGEATKIFRLDNVRTCTNDLRDFYAVAFVGMHYNGQVTPDGTRYTMNIKGPLYRVDQTIPLGQNIIDQTTNNIQYYGSGLQQHAWNTNASLNFDYRFATHSPSAWNSIIAGDDTNNARFRVWQDGNRNNTLVTVAPGTSAGYAGIDIRNIDASQNLLVSLQSANPGMDVYGGALYFKIAGATAQTIDTSRNGIYWGPNYTMNGNLIVVTNIVANGLSSNASPVNTIGQLSDGTFVKIANGGTGTGDAITFDDGNNILVSSNAGVITISTSNSMTLTNLTVNNSASFASATVGGGIVSTGNVYSASALSSGFLVQGGGGNNVSATSVATANVPTATASITDNSVVRGDGGSKGLQGSGVTIDDSNNIDTPGGVSANSISVAANADVGGNMVALGVVEGTYIIPDNNVKYASSVALPSSQLTNYTVTVSVAESKINATNHVHFSTVAGATAGYTFFCGFTITNGSSKNLTFDPAWIPLADTYTNRLNATVRVVVQVDEDATYYQVSR